MLAAAESRSRSAALKGSPRYAIASMRRVTCANNGCMSVLCVASNAREDAAIKRTTQRMHQQTKLQDRADRVSARQVVRHKDLLVNGEPRMRGGVTLAQRPRSMRMAHAPIAISMSRPRAFFDVR